jgi:predicted HTH domain antitoxin
MQVTIEIPDAIVQQIEELGGSTQRELLEAFVLEEYRKERLSRGRVSELLGLNFWETEEFLRNRGAYLHFGADDFERDTAVLNELLSQ